MTQTTHKAACADKAESVMSSPPRIHRLRNSQLISEIFRTGLRAWDNCATMIAISGETELTRLALAVGKKSHGNAVKRNRVKRLCREAFRLSLDKIPKKLDIVYIPRGGKDFDIAALSKSMISLSKRLEKKIAAQSSGNTPPADNNSERSGS